MNDKIDFDRLRRDLMDYYGTAMSNGFPIAVIELSKIECADEEALVVIARKSGVDLSKYLY